MNILNILFKFKSFYGDWGLGIGDWGPIPNPQSPIPNPQSPKKLLNLNNIFILLNIFKILF